MKINFTIGDDVNKYLPKPIKDLRTKEECDIAKKYATKSVGRLNNSLKNIPVSFQSDKEAVDYVEWVVLNRVFCRGIFKNDRRRDENFTKQQIISIDIDSGVDPNKLINVLTQWKIPPNIVYSSIRDDEGGDKRKFRVVYILRNGIPRRANEDLVLINKKFTTYIGGDSNTRDLSRLFFPGKKILYRNDIIPSRNEILIGNIKDFVDNIELDPKLKLSDDKLKLYYDGPIVKFIEDYTFNINRIDLSNSVFRYDKMDIVLKDRSKYQRYSFNYTDSQFKVVNVFFTENVRYSFDIIKGLMMNLKFVTGGSKKVLNRMKEINKNGGGKYIQSNGEISTKIEKYPRSYIDRMRALSKKTDLLPMSLSNFSPFEEDHKYKNLLETGETNWGNISITEKRNKKILKDVDKFFPTMMTKILNKPLTRFKSDEKEGLIPKKPKPIKINNIEL